jgi:hypothetical protein
MKILRQGAKVYHYQMMDIHAGGHAKREELKKIIRLLRPKFFIAYSWSIFNVNFACGIGKGMQNKRKKI